jgi:hypothetical protein
LNYSQNFINQLNAAVANGAQMNGIAINADAGAPPAPPMAPPLVPPTAPPIVPAASLQGGVAYAATNYNLSNNATVALQQQLVQVQQQLLQLQQNLLLQQQAHSIPAQQHDQAMLMAYQTQQTAALSHAALPTSAPQSMDTSLTSADAVSIQMIELGF